MLRLLMPVRSGVAIGGVVAAPDVTARLAHPQVNPLSAHAEAVLATVARRRDGVDRAEMGARVCHAVIVNTHRVAWGAVVAALPSVVWSIGGRGSF